MRPIKLALSAFGPFSGTEEIEFARLGDNPLFLINGPTGSGKTTILDGICFALYGRTTGDEREAAQMRCDAAAPDCLTRVELIFRLRGVTWRIVREPEQMRPKGRGEGQTLHQPRAELYRRDTRGGESVVVASKVTEARLAIEELTGLNVEQFRQVMVLPQGEFRNLLMAKSADREKVFSHLFQTQIYTRIELALKEKAAAVRQQLEARLNQQKGILHSADIEDEIQLNEALESERIRLERSSKAREKALKRRQEADALALSARRVVADFERLAQAEETLVQLQLQEEIVDTLRSRLELGQVAQRIRPEFDHWQSVLKAGLELARERIEEENTILAGQQRLEQARLDLDAVLEREPKIEAARLNKSRLESYRDRVGQYDQATQSLQACLATQDRTGEHRQACHLRAHKVEADMEGLKRDQQALLARLELLGDMRLQSQNLEQRYQQRETMEEIRLELSHCEARIVGIEAARVMAATDLKRCQQESAQLEFDWHAGQAAVLAGQLENNHPCPVCGSEQHPAPAHSETEIPSDRVRRAAALAATQAHEKLVSLDTEVAGLQSRSRQLQESESRQKKVLGQEADLSLQALADRRDAHKGDLQSLQADQVRERDIAERIATLSDSLLAIRVDLEQVDQAYAEALTRTEVARSRMDAAETELPERYRQLDILESEIALNEREIEDFQLQKETMQQTLNNENMALEKSRTRRDTICHQLKQTQKAEELANKAWLQAVSDSPLADENHFRQSMLGTGQMAELELQIQQHKTELDQARGALKTLQHVLSGQEKPDLKEVEAIAEQAKIDYDTAESAYTNADKRQSRLQEIVRKLASSKSKVQELEEEYALIGTLADTANGRVGNRVSLQRFVLSVLLDDVLLMASQRFKQMSKGRYALYRRREKSKGAGASGLDLLVDDAYTGKHRPVATLSGGESFMAALSLALGLSDVVQAYAGGIRLDTLFIDEGFGSLDPESLDLAVNTLIDLQSSGRMVGVISHVPELKERINVRLDVIADRAGSHTRTVLA